MMIEKIEEDGELLVVVIRNDYNKDGLNFLTNNDHSFQIGIHNVKKGKRYRAHKSKPFKKLENLKANKIYYIKEGKVDIDVYNKKDEIIGNFILYKGDLVLFVKGGHGVTMLENTKMIEIKQGPYRGVDEDKIFLE